MNTAFQNAYEFALAYVMTMSEAHEEITKTSIWLDAEQALRDWDAFAGPRHTDYKPEAYELTDSQWKDCQSAVMETAEARLWDRVVDKVV